MRPLQVRVPAGDEVWQPVAGTAVYVQLDSRAAVNVTVRDREGSQEYYLKPGSAVRMKPFQRLWVEHDGAGTEDLILWIGEEGEEGQVFEISGVIDIAQASSFANTAVTVGTAAVQLIAAGTRKQVKIQNNGTDPIYIGPDATVTTGNGFRIGSGETLIEESLAGSAFWAISGTAGQAVIVQAG